MSTCPYVLLSVIYLSLCMWHTLHCLPVPVCCGTGSAAYLSLCAAAYSLPSYVFRVLDFTLRSLIRLELTLCRVEDEGLVSFCSCGFQLFPAPCMEDTVFPRLHFWHLCQNSGGCVWPSAELFYSIPLSVLCQFLCPFHFTNEEMTWKGAPAAGEVEQPPASVLLAHCPSSSHSTLLK